MKRLLTCVALALVLLPAAARAVVVNRVVLRINDRIATLTEFERQLAERQRAILGATDVDPERRRELLANAGRRVLADLYEELLLLSRADQLGVRVTDLEVAQQVIAMRDRMGLESEDAFREALASAGLTEAGLRDRLRRNLLVQGVMGREVQARIAVDEDQLRRYWREHPEEFTAPAAVKLQDVVVLSEGREPAEVAQAARELRAELAAGAPIEEVAARWSAQGRTTGVVELGWVERDDLDPALERAAWELSPGGISEPVEGRGGLHVLRLVERREAAVRPFNEVKAELEARERQRRMAEEYREYLAELEARSHVALHVPPQAEGFRGLGEAADDEDQPFAAEGDLGEADGAAGTAGEAAPEAAPGGGSGG